MRNPRSGNDLLQKAWEASLDEARAASQKGARGQELNKDWRRPELELGGTVVRRTGLANHTNDEQDGQGVRHKKERRCRNATEKNQIGREMR
jgi:hypothetical protein